MTNQDKIANQLRFLFYYRKGSISLNEKEKSYKEWNELSNFNKEGWRYLAKEIIQLLQDKEYYNLLKRCVDEMDENENV